VNALRAQGALVTCVVAYQTVIGSGGVVLPRLLRREEIDAITLTSSSAATNLKWRVLNEGGDETALRQVPIGCIGERTAETARAQGLRVVAVPEEHSLSGLVESLEEYFAREAITTQQEANDGDNRV
jgi:uroporphyrinogen-III synthase